MRNYSEKYPKLSLALKDLTVDSNLCDDQFLLILNCKLTDISGLRQEILDAFEDPEISWKEVLNNDYIGEVYETDDETDAIDFAKEMILKPTVAFRNL